MPLNFSLFYEQITYHNSCEADDIDSAVQRSDEEKLRRLVEKMKDIIASRGDRLLSEAQEYHETKVN
jgi:hypothetical protein